MDLDRLAVRLRPRTDWEAVDLGFAMIRAWWRPVYAAWLSVALPVALILILLGGGWGFVAFWWIMPLFEATTLAVLARTVFGETTPLAQVLRQAPKEWRRFLPDATWRRLDLKRSFRLPVTSLERSSGAERRARLQILAIRSSDAPSWLSFVFFFFALGLAVAFIAAVVMLTPPWLGIDWDLIDQQMDAGEAPWAWKAIFLVWAVMILAVDPIYIAAGFCLYLNRRTDLEGWDLEIALRSMAKRIRRLRKPAPNAAAFLAPWILGALLAAAFIWPPQTGAQDIGAQDIGVQDTNVQTKSTQVESAPDSNPPDSNQPDSNQPDSVGDESEQKSPSEVIAEVMALDELQTSSDVEKWQLRSDLDWLNDDDDGEAWSFDSNFTGALIGITAQIFEILLWVGLGLLVLLMLREIWRGAPKIRSRRLEMTHQTPEKIAGLDVRRESLPDDIAGTAAELWRSGRRIEALGLLYRASLSRLHAEGLELRESFTEADCLIVARRHLSTERSRFFAALTTAWQRAAYAHRLPEDTAAESLISSWRQSFDAARTIAPGSTAPPAESTSEAAR